MRILVFGNINAGKSTVIKRLSQKLPNYKVIEIDDYRKKFVDGSHEGEYRAVCEFTFDASESFNSIIECTGLGPLGNKLFDSLSGKGSIMLHVLVNCA